MITLDNYGSIIGKGTIGQIHKQQSDMVMDKTWKTDISAKVGYFFDYEHDTHLRQLKNFDPTKDDYLIPINIKHFESAAQTYSKDAVTFHIQFRPHQSSDVVPYYKELFEDRYDATFPVGLYCLIPDADGYWNRWLVVDKANSNDPQFPDYEVLRCDKIINYIFNGKKYYIPAVSRSQNS